MQGSKNLLQGDVSASLPEIIIVDKDSLQKTVVKYGWIIYDEVYATLPEDRTPAKKYVKVQGGGKLFKHNLMYVKISNKFFIES